MKGKLKFRSFIFDYIICGIFLFSTFFHYSIDVYFGGINYIASSLFYTVLFIILITFFIKCIIRIIKNRDQLNVKLFSPVLVYIVTIPLSFVLPGSEIFKSNVVIKAHYKGTQNQAVIKFRNDKTFDLNCTGVFGYNEWFMGSYSQKGDTLFLKYSRPKPQRFGSKVLIEANKLVALDKPIGNTQHFLPFTIMKE